MSTSPRPTPSSTSPRQTSTPSKLSITGRWQSATPKNAVDFAYAAVEEAESSVLDAALARAHADESSSEISELCMAFLPLGSLLTVLPLAFVMIAGLQIIGFVFLATSAE